MSLRATFCGIGVTDWVKGVEEPPSWCVENPHDIFHGQPAIVVSGFARKVDAEMAARALEKTGIQWDSVDDLDRQWDEFGGRPAIYKEAFSALQW